MVYRGSKACPASTCRTPLSLSSLFLHPTQRPPRGTVTQEGRLAGRSSRQPTDSRSPALRATEDVLQTEVQSPAAATCRFVNQFISRWAALSGPPHAGHAVPAARPTACPALAARFLPAAGRGYRPPSGPGSRVLGGRRMGVGRSCSGVNQCTHPAGDSTSGIGQINGDVWLVLRPLLQPGDRRLRCRPVLRDRAPTAG